MQQSQKEVLKAWIDGATIQYKDGDNWFDCHAFDSCNRVYFNDDAEYRIKPAQVVTETLIETWIDREVIRHITYTDQNTIKNLRLTWEDGKLVKAEVI